MKFVLGISSVLCLAGIVAAQDCNSKAAPGVKSTPTKITVAAAGKQTQLTREAKEFVKTGPVVFGDMDQARRVADKAGKTVVCWVSEDANPLSVFNDPTVRLVSAALDDTTIQVAMGRNPTKDKTDRDGKPLGARVEFSTSNYDETARTAYIPVGKLKEADTTRILAFTRGGRE